MYIVIRMDISDKN